MYNVECVDDGGQINNDVVVVVVAVVTNFNIEKYVI